MEDNYSWKYSYASVDDDLADTIIAHVESRKHFPSNSEASASELLEKYFPMYAMHSDVTHLNLQPHMIVIPTVMKVFSVNSQQ